MKNYLVGEHLTPALVKALQKMHPSHLVLISDRRLSRFSNSMENALRRQFSVSHYKITAGESAKDFGNLLPIYSHLVKNAANRHSVIVALGGGVVGDISGFIAATFQRGIRWVGCPTTLLAQVDSAVGGKTGVNHPLGKNLIGAFHPPRFVFSDGDYLATLSDRDLISGLAEMVKIALVLDRAFYRHLESVWPHLLKRNKTVLRQAITRAVKLKLSVVAEDPFEKTGKRRLLNFGHTVGHALESATRYKKFRHGEAVLWGMRVAVVLSEICGHLAPENGAEIQKFLKQFPVGPWPAAISTRDLLPFIKRDKKAEGQSIPYILLKAAGESTIDRKVTPADLTSALARIKNDEI